MEHGAIHEKVVDMLSKMQEQSTDERIIKMNLARERIDGEYQTLVEKAIKSMRVATKSTTNIPVPAHLRRLLEIFCRPGIKEAFLLYAKKTAAGVIDRYGDEKKQSRASSEFERTVTDNDDVSNFDPSSTSLAMRFRPLRRAVSLNYVVPHPQPTISGVVVIDDPEKRRQATFGSGPSTRGEGRMGFGRKQESGVPTGRVRGSGQGDSMRKIRGTRSSKTDQDDVRGTKWRVHGDSERIDLTLTADSAVGRVPIALAVGAGEALKKSQGRSDPSTSSTATVESAESIYAKVRELELKKRQGTYIHA